MRVQFAGSLLAAVTLFAPPSVSGAQDAAPAAHPWAAFLGCWRPTAPGSDGIVTCIVPSAESPLAVEQLQVVANVVQQRTTLTANGTRNNLTEASCEAWDVASISEDASRVYVRGGVKCADATETTSSGLFSIAPNGQLLQIFAVVTGEERRVTSQRLDPVAAEAMPLVAIEALGVYAAETQARTDAALPLSIDAIADVQHVVDATAVERWMIETLNSEHGFRVTRRDLQRLAAANADARVIDMAVMLANPAQFTAARVRTERTQSGMLAGQNAQRCDAMMSFAGDFMFMRTQMGRGAPMLPWMMQGMAFMGQGLQSLCPGYGLLYRRWGFFSPYGYYGLYGDGLVNPVPGGEVPVGSGQTPSSERRTVTKQNGFSSGTVTSMRPAQPRNVVGPATTSSGANRAGVERSPDATSTGRTAKPRNP